MNPYYWFLFDGSGSIIDPGNFNKVNVQPNCSGLTKLCAIWAQAQTVSGVIRPIIAGTLLESAIPVVVGTSTPTLSILLKN